VWILWNHHVFLALDCIFDVLANTDSTNQKEFHGLTLPNPEKDVNNLLRLTEPVPYGQEISLQLLDLLNLLCQVGVRTVHKDVLA
jgi:hypothetical protein